MRLGHALRQRLQCSALHCRARRVKLNFGNEAQSPVPFGYRRNLQHFTDRRVGNDGELCMPIAVFGLLILSHTKVRIEFFVRDSYNLRVLDVERLFLANLNVACLLAQSQPNKPQASGNSAPPTGWSCFDYACIPRSRPLYHDLVQSI